MGNNRRSLRARRRTSNNANSTLLKALQAGSNLQSPATVLAASVTAGFGRNKTASASITVSVNARSTVQATFEPRTEVHSTFDFNSSDMKLVTALQKGKCGLCGSETSLICPLCWKTYYCDKIHQMGHFSQHRRNCFPLEEMSVQDLKALTDGGRGPMGPGPYMKATRDIKGKEMIYEEPPIVTGPGISADLPYEPLCLGCNLPTSNKCSKCKWPVCGVDCEKNLMHTAFECGIFAKRGIQELYEPFQYELLRVLRCLLMKYRDPEKYEALLKLDAALERRNNIPLLQEATNTACFFINKNCGLRQFDRKTINHMCGVVDLQTQVTGDYRSSMQIYPFPSKLLHDCQANARLVEVPSLSEEGVILLRVMAIRPISRGEPISIRGVINMQPTFERQRFMWNYYYFRCNCKSCQDPTEHGTFFSAIRCKECVESMAPGTETVLDLQEGNRFILSETPPDLYAPWRCKTCRKQVESRKIHDMYHQLDADYVEFRASLCDKPIEEKIILLKARINLLEEVLHPGNFQIWRVKQLMLGVLSQKIQTMDPPDTWEQFEEIYEEVDELALDVMTTVRILQPGLTLSRGRTLYDLISTKWAYIQWAVIYGKAPTFMKHPNSSDFLSMVAELLIIFRYETGFSIKALVNDVYYMKNNTNAMQKRLRECNWDLDKLQGITEESEDEVVEPDLSSEDPSSSSKEAEGDE